MLYKKEQGSCTCFIRFSGHGGQEGSCGGLMVGALDFGSSGLRKLKTSELDHGDISIYLVLKKDV